MRGGREKIIERSAELARIGEMLGLARKGRGGFVLIGAEAGMGKTALLEEGIRSAGRRRYRVLRTRATRVQGAADDGVVSRLWELARHRNGAAAAAGSCDGGQLEQLLVDLGSAGPVATVWGDLLGLVAGPGTRGNSPSRLTAFHSFLVISRAPRPRVTKLTDQRIRTRRRFWKPIR
jgi:hypothetical protein